MTYYMKDFDFDEDDEESESDFNSSSEDEIDIILHGTPEQKRKLQHLYRKPSSGNRKALVAKYFDQKDSSSEDDFEKELNAELDQEVKGLVDAQQGVHSNIATKSDIIQQTKSCSGSSSTVKSDKKPVKEQVYDDVYFDSDEEMDENPQGQKKSSTQHPVISNDDLLYDPKMDEDDQRWVDRQRRNHVRPGGGGKKQKMPNSDAMLDCPACMTTLCLDCQRHEIYKSQYRAMFVMNCTVDVTESLQCPEQLTKKDKKKRKKASKGASSEQTGSTGNDEPKDQFHPVKCAECNTVVGVIDSDEVYHFFNILASHT